MSKRRRASSSPGDLLLALAWYRPEDWNRLRELSIDRDNLEDTHAEWLAVANRTVLDLMQRGARVRRVIVELDELVEWCRVRKRPLNGDARAAFVAEKVSGEELPKNPK